ncbi:hypothetical protein ACFLZ9_01220 [Patescibacteria group bacterium]
MDLLAYLFASISLSLGMILGFFLKTRILIAISFISFYYLWDTNENLKSEKELAAVYVIVMNIMMWFVWYFSSNQSFIQDFFKDHILR